MSIGNLKDSGNQGNNFPWQLKVLQGLQAIFDEVAQPLTCVEDSVTICPPAGGLDVNIHDGAGTAITSTPDGLGNTGIDVNIIGGVTLEVNLDAANDQVGIYGYNGTTPTPISVDSNGFLNTNVIFPSSLAVTQDPASDPWTVDASDLDIRNLTFATDKVDVSGSSVIISDGSGPVTVDGTVNIGTMPEVEIKNDSGNPIPVTGTVTITDGSGPITVDGTVTSNQGTSPWVVSGSVNIGTMPEVEIKNDSGNPIPVSGTVTITDGAGPITVDATALDIRALDCGTDSVSICDGTNNLAIDLNGSISSNLYANDLVSGSPELVTTTGGVGYQALDVNVVAPINTITPNILSVTDSGVIAPAVYSITFFNSGPDDELISFDGGATPVVLSPGVSITMDAGGIANKYPAGVFAYDVIASGPIIITYNS
jgi:hypothetical protein